MAGLALLALAGCATTDPYERPAMWQPVGANARNLAAMVADPRDLIRGHGDGGSNGALAQAAVTKLGAGRSTGFASGSPAQGSSQAVAGGVGPSASTSGAN